MSPWYGKTAVLLNLLGHVVIRWPYQRRSAKARVVEDRGGGQEAAVLALALLATSLLPALWLTTRLLAFAEYPLWPVPYWLGVLFLAAGLRLFYRSHADLGSNWSMTLQIKEDHRLVTTGVYARVRHPMYSALLLGGVGQLLVLPNWIAGPSSLIGFGFVCLLRIGPEERMMLDRFGPEYEAYRRRSGRLIPRRPA